MVRNRGVVIVIPAYNEEAKIGDVISDLNRNGYEDIIVVDDGSKDNTYKIAKSHKADVYKHIINRGLGGSLGTGIKAALMKNADIVVTFDADGQHAASDIKKLIKPIIDGKADVVIGSRLMIKSDGMPFIRKIGNWGMNLITYVMFGIWTTDSQSGLRAFSRKAAEKISIKGSRMEVSSEIISEVGKRKLKFKEVPIKAIYTDYSLKKGQSNLNAFKILLKLVVKKLMR
ncbi:MAG: glycosyltransferase family 2 protein [Candidatus Woesearchaeota archaeon]|nr:glycosyltransferase family 2 protein [Candidatus Woesearchaeota archaeon]